MVSIDFIKVVEEWTTPFRGNKYSLFKQVGSKDGPSEDLTRFADNLINFSKEMYNNTNGDAKYEVRRQLFNSLIASSISATRQDITNQAVYENRTKTVISQEQQKTKKETKTTWVQTGFRDEIVDRPINMHIIPVIDCKDNADSLKKKQEAIDNVYDLFNGAEDRLKEAALKYCVELIKTSGLGKVSSDVSFNIAALSTDDADDDMNSNTIYPFLYTVVDMFREELSGTREDLHGHLWHFVTAAANKKYLDWFYSLCKDYQRLKLKQKAVYNEYMMIRLNSLFPSFDLLNLKHLKTCESTPSYSALKTLYNSKWESAMMNQYEARLEVIRTPLALLFDEYEKAPIGDLENPKPKFLQMLRNRMSSMIKSVMSVKDTLNGPLVGNLLMKSYLIQSPHRDVKTDTSPYFTDSGNTPRSVEEMIENMSPMGARWILLPTAKFNEVARALYGLCHRATGVTGSVGQSVGLSAFKATYGGGREAGEEKKTYVVYNGRRYLVRKLDRKRAIKVGGVLVALKDLKGWKKAVVI